MGISVVIPAYNAERYLDQTIRSVLAQSVPDWELTLVDDGSTDSTPMIAAAFARSDARVRVIRQANSGTAAARNRGFFEASQAAEYTAFLDHDDVWEDDALESLLQALAERPEAVAASGLSRRIGADSLPIGDDDLERWGRSRRGVAGFRLVSWPPHLPTTLGALAYRNCILTPGQVLIRTAALRTAGPFDPQASPCDDWDMWLRLSQLGCIAYLGRVALGWRSHDGNTSADEALMIQKQEYVREKLLSAAHLTADQRRLVMMANAYWGRALYSARIRLATRSLRHGHLRQAFHLFCRAAARYAHCVRGLPAS
jgi:glycosyltransferase involved in cell wall biosynthesis